MMVPDIDTYRGFKRYRRRQTVRRMLSFEAVIALAAVTGMAILVWAASAK